MENWDPSIDPTFRRGQCAFYTWPWSMLATFDEDTLREQGNAAQERLFRDYLPAHDAQIERGERTLRRLREVDPAAAGLFDIKPYLAGSMTLRLINGETDEAPKSYTALSYCWPQTSETPEPGAPARRRMPVSPLIFQHLVMQRETADEGVWCDQLCIDQADKAEKAATIASMDALYRCARVVAVALEDIEVSPVEQAFLRAFIADYEDTDRCGPLPPPHVLESPPFMSRHPVLLGFFAKVCGSRWFRRAWCSHEMRLARRHRFLVRCAGRPENTLLSFSDFFMAYLVMLSAPVAVPDEVREIRHTLSRVFNFATYVDELRRFLRGEPEAAADQGATPAYTSHVAEVFALEAGGDPEAEDRERDADLDRITIVLNTVGGGLCLKREEAAKSQLTASAERCERLLLTVALAAGDPTSLCTNGKPFRFVDGQDSWLRRPNHTDIGSGAKRQEPLRLMDDFPLELDPSVDLAWASLDLLCPGALQPPSAALRELAELLVLVARKIGLGGGPLGQDAQGPEYLGWRMEADSEDRAVNFVGIIAVILQFGPDWMLGMAEKCGFASLAVLEDIRGPVREHFAEGFDAAYLLSPQWTRSASGLKAVDSLMRVAYWMAGWSMSATEQTAPERASWRPWICPLGGSKAMVIAPEGLEPAIPLALFRAGYDRLPRVWLLSGKSDEGKSDERVELKGKSVLFANLSSDEHDAAVTSCPREHLKVYGPS